MSEDGDKSVIGWREVVNLPDWGIVGIVGKADTGARSSAIDVSNLEELPSGRVRFEVAASRGRREKRFQVEALVVRRTRVKSSLGTSHRRLFVRTVIQVAGRTFQAELGLVNRHRMLCRMLLGRRSLAGLFVVDPERCYLHGRPRRGRTDPEAKS